MFRIGSCVSCAIMGAYTIIYLYFLDGYLIKNLNFRSAFYSVITFIAAITFFILLLLSYVKKDMNLLILVIVYRFSFEVAEIILGLMILSIALLKC